MNKEELKQKIEDQKAENIRLFNIFQYNMHKEDMQPLIQQWREGSTKIKALLNELYKIEEEEREDRLLKEKDQPKETRTFINGFGEATKRNITSSTYDKAERRRQKEVLSFMGH